MITASLHNYRQSPRKVRLVADLIRGKQVSNALTVLQFTTKEAAPILQKLVLSAIANAKHNFKLDQADLYIKDIQVGAGRTLKRFRAGARGTPSPILKRTSQVELILDVTPIKEPKKETKKSEKKVKENKESKK